MNSLKSFSISTLLVGFAFAVFACAENDSDVAGGAQDLSATHGTCGGATCGDGLRCCNDKCQPAGLACSILGSEGQVCGDDVAIQKKCASGLMCVFPSSGPVSEHTPGICQKTLVLDGEWGADNAILTIDAGKGGIEFGCGTASIDSIAQTGPSAFAGTGTQTPGSGVEPPPGLGAKPAAATFAGTVSGKTLTLEMTVDGNVSKLTFTKDRHLDLAFCP